LTFAYLPFIIKVKELDYIKKEEGKMNRQENRIAVAAEIEGLIEEIYERLDCIREISGVCGGYKKGRKVLAGPY